MEIRTVRNAYDLERFLKLPYDIYRDDPAWVPPLLSNEKARLDDERNPLFRRASRELFLAWNGSQVVGRAVAVRDRDHSGDDGVFGFFETVDDGAVCGALVDACARWLADRGAKRLVGPMNLTSMEEFGVVVEGQDRRPPFLAAHTPPYYQRLLEEQGFEKERDTMAFERPLFDAAGNPLLPPAGLVAAARAAADYTVRPVRLDRWHAEIDATHHVLNESFRDVEGYAHVSRSEFAGLARQFKSIMDPRILLLAERAGEIAGFAFLFPDINEVLARLGGRLFPLGWLKALILRKRIKTCSFKLAGVLPAHRKSGLAAHLALQAAMAAQRIGYTRLEASVVNENNVRMREFIELQGATPYLRYRLYSRALA